MLMWLDAWCMRMTRVAVATCCKTLYFVRGYVATNAILPIQNNRTEFPLETSIRILALEAFWSVANN